MECDQKKEYLLKWVLDPEYCKIHPDVQLQITGDEQKLEKICYQCEEERKC
jgi:hypothetical protein